MPQSVKRLPSRSRRAPIQAPRACPWGESNNEMDDLISLAQLSLDKELEHEQLVAHTTQLNFESAPTYMANSDFNPNYHQEQVSASQMKMSEPPPQPFGLESTVPIYSGIFDSQQSLYLDIHDPNVVLNWVSKEACGYEQLGHLTFLDKIKVPSESKSDSKNSIEDNAFQMNSKDFPALRGAVNESAPDTEVVDDHLISQCKVEPASARAPPSAPASARAPASAPASAHAPASAPASARAPASALDIEDPYGIRNLAIRLLSENGEDASKCHANRGFHAPDLVGIDLATSEPVLPRFRGPFATTFAPVETIEFPVPKPYCVDGACVDLRKKRLAASLKQFNEDILFYLFYSQVQDLLQHDAAAELYERGWRYHIPQQIWITRIPHVLPEMMTDNCESGIYFVWDAQAWEKSTQRMSINFEFIAGRPKLSESDTDSHTGINHVFRTGIHKTTSTHLP